MKLGSVGTVILLFVLVVAVALSLLGQGRSLTRFYPDRFVQQQKRFSGQKASNKNSLPISQAKLSKSLMSEFQTKRSRSQSPSFQEKDDNYNCSMVNDNCIAKLAARIHRVWPQRPFKTWCVTKDNASRNNVMRLIKVPKSASSTAAAVALRIQYWHGCNVQWGHGSRRDDINNTNINRSEKMNYYWAPVRTPDARALSDVYYNQISFHRRHTMSNRTPADAFIQKHLQQIQPNFISNYLYPFHNFSISDTFINIGGGEDRSTSSANVTITKASDTTSTLLDNILAKVNEIVISYDFLMVTDRLVESLVVLSLLTNLPLTSLVTLSSKQSGSWYLAVKKNNKIANANTLQKDQLKCIPLTPPVDTLGVKTFFASDDWKIRHQVDRLLYAVANQSLDATIATWQPDLFEKQYRTFLELQQRVQRACGGGGRKNANSSYSYAPCSADGQVQLERSQQHCYARDFGCGYPCIDRELGMAVDNTFIRT